MGSKSFWKTLHSSFHEARDQNTCLVHMQSYLVDPTGGVRLLEAYLGVYVIENWSLILAIYAIEAVLAVVFPISFYLK